MKALIWVYVTSEGNFWFQFATLFNNNLRLDNRELINYGALTNALLDVMYGCFHLIKLWLTIFPSSG